MARRVQKKPSKALQHRFHFISSLSHSSSLYLQTWLLQLLFPSWWKQTKSAPLGPDMVGTTLGIFYLHVYIYTAYIRKLLKYVSVSSMHNNHTNIKYYYIIPDINDYNTNYKIHTDALVIWLGIVLFSIIICTYFLYTFDICKQYVNKFRVLYY